GPKRAYAIIKSYVEDEPAQTYVHTCVYVRATHAAQLLNKFIGNVQIVETPVRQPGERGGGGGGGDRPPFGGGGGGDRPPFGGGGGNNPTAQPPAPQPNRLRNQPLTITADEVRNQVLIKGPPDKIGHAKTALMK